jgi:hypothetical protein
MTTNFLGRQLPVPFLSGRAGLLLVLLASWACCGCRSKGIAPALETAREGLETALTAWKNGHAVGRLDGPTCPIQVEDGDWFKGKRLASFEILDADVKEYGFPCFTVRLQFADPPDTKDARYLVHKGGDLLWVRQEQDYKRSMNWEAYEPPANK